MTRSLSGGVGLRLRRPAVCAKRRVPITREDRRAGRFLLPARLHSSIAPTGGTACLVRPGSFQQKDRLSALTGKSGKRNAVLYCSFLDCMLHFSSAFKYALGTSALPPK